ncbi:MAG: glycogen synthase GlgA, partial [Mariprofundaceae bacterium]|nr:glycogen synthase GlgA [Mariprofundaceae bacterium]
MPSRFEPCGLGQLMSMRYANIPVVRATGGLKDTVNDYTQDKKNATGFAFSEATPAAFNKAVDVAVETWKRPATWKRIMGNAARRDSSWDASAAAYAEMYQSLID